AFSNTEDSSATTKKNNLKINLAISEFKNLKKISKYNWLKLGIPELMASFLSNTKGIKLLERGNLNKVLEEQSRVQSGIIDATNSAEFGKIAGASHMMTGSYHINNNKITINARMIKTETGQQLRAENITGNINDINEIVKKVVLKLSGSIGNILTAEEKQKIAEQGKGMMKKIEAVSKGQLSLKSGDIDAARKYYTDALRNDPNNETLKKLLKDIDVSLKALAIVEFKNNNNDSKYNVFSKSIPADLTSLMIQKTGLPFVERLRIDATIAEMALPQDGLIDPKTAPEFGKIVGASQLISGSFNINNNKITIHTRLIDTQTGVNSFSYSETGAIDDIKKIETKIVDQFIQSLMNVIVTKNPIKIATKTRGIAKSIDDALSEGKKEASFNLEESVVQFDFGKDTIKPSSYTVLKEIAQVLKEHPEYRIYILGHTDNVGTAENNKTLSERRAKNVMKKFIQYGAIAVKLNAIGEGEDNPIADNSTENGRSKNRRVGLLFKK
ncbi:MAG: OmpA family protein, partial [Methylococcales bacterium]|nr:OmpA family protein [Methylococcales bacterium]